MACASENYICYSCKIHMTHAMDLELNTRAFVPPFAPYHSFQLEEQRNARNVPRFWAPSIRPKFPEIPVQNRMEQKFSGNSFRKFRFTSRGCPFFSVEIWKFRKCPVPFGISTRYESAPVPLVVKLSYKMAASLSTRHCCKMICHSSSLFWIENKILGSDFLQNCRLVVPNFLWVSSPGLHTLQREKFA